MASDFRYVSGGGTIADASGTLYPRLDASVGQSTEIWVQTDILQSYTVKNLFAYCTVFSGTGTTTVANRDTGVTGAVTVTVNATGIFEDTSNTASIVNNDLVNNIFTKTGGKMGESVTVWGISCVLSHASSNYPILIVAPSASLSALTTRFYAISGFSSNATESNVQRTFRAVATLTNLRLYVSAYSLGVAAPYILRKNSGDGTNTVTPNATGSFEDTTSTDSISVGDEVNTEGDALLSVSGAITVNIIQYLSASTAKQHIMIEGTSRAFDITLYYVLTGGVAAPVSVSGDEANVQVTQRTTNLLQNLYVYVSAYTLNAGATADLRINAASSVVTVTPNATGVFEDTSNSVTLVATDEANYRLDTFAASSGAITVQIISVEETQPAAPFTAYGRPFGQVGQSQQMQLLSR